MHRLLAVAALLSVPVAAGAAEPPKTAGAAAKITAPSTAVVAPDMRPAPATQPALTGKAAAAAQTYVRPSVQRPATNTISGSAIIGEKGQEVIGEKSAPAGGEEGSEAVIGEKSRADVPDSK